MKNDSKHQIEVYRRNQRKALGLDKPTLALRESQRFTDPPETEIIDAEWEECQNTDLIEVSSKGKNVFIKKMVVNHYHQGRHQEPAKPRLLQPEPAKPAPIDNWSLGIILGACAFSLVGLVTFLKALFTIGGLL